MLDATMLHIQYITVPLLEGTVLYMLQKFVYDMKMLMSSLTTSIYCIGLKSMLMTFA